ncbi:hypothetical protein ACFE04_014713 [Oxalis oulophora]
MATSSVDRISETPVGILHHILSFLSYKNVTQLSVLSKTWKQVSLTHPNLKFDPNFFSNFFVKEDMFFLFLLIEYEKNVEKILNRFVVVERILTTFNDQRLAINKFQLQGVLITDFDFSSRYDGWIRQAVDANVRELQLSFQSVIFEEYFLYTLPQFVFLAKSLVTLTLRRCKLTPISMVDLPSLKKLDLDDVELNDHLPQKLLANIEDLSLANCKGFNSLHFSDPLKLKKLKLSYHANLERVYVKASSLIEFNFIGGKRLKEIDIKHCKNLRSIKMRSVDIVSKWLNEGLSYYPTLEILCFLRCENLDVANISSASLNTLLIDHCRDLNGVKLDAPNLSKLTYNRESITSQQMLSLYSVSGIHSLLS